MPRTIRSATIAGAPARRPATATNSDRAALLRATEIFGGLEERDLATLATYSRVRRMRKGEVIYRKGDPDASMVVVLAGLVKISVPSALEREVVLNVIHDGEVFGEIALIDGRPRSADATAMTGGDLLVLDRRVVLPFLRANADVAIRLLETLCARIRRTSEQVEDMRFLDSTGRLAKTLIWLARGAGGAGANDISVTQRELGQMVASSRESVNKQLQQWQRSGWIELRKGGVTIRDGRRLRRLLADRADEATAPS